MTSRTFEGKIAFVTGATSGIGQGVALAFAREGATVIGCGRNASRGAQTQRLVEAGGGAFLFLPMDLGDEAQIAGAVRTAMDRYGRLDCAVNLRGRRCERQLPRLYRRGFRPDLRHERPRPVPVPARAGGRDAARR